MTLNEKPRLPGGQEEREEHGWSGWVLGIVDLVRRGIGGVDSQREGNTRLKRIAGLFVSCNILTDQEIVDFLKELPELKANIYALAIMATLIRWAIDGKTEPVDMAKDGAFTSRYGLNVSLAAGGRMGSGGAFSSGLYFADGGTEDICNVLGCNDTHTVLVSPYWQGRIKSALSELILSPL